MKQTVFYGCLYEDEVDDYKDIIETQFKKCAEKAKAEDMEIVRWGFDITVDDEAKRKTIQEYVEACAEKYFPGVLNVAVIEGETI